MMNRKEFFGMFAMLFGLQMATPRTPFPPVEPLKPGEERCPACRQAQKPMRLSWVANNVEEAEHGLALVSDKAPIFTHVSPHVCSNCGSVYVQPQPKPEGKP